MPKEAQTTEPAAPQENGLLGQTPNQGMEKFEGFSTKDGERQPAYSPDPDPDSASTPQKGAKPAPKLDGAQGDEADGEKHKSAQQRINKAVGRQRAAERRAASSEAAYDSLNSKYQTLEQRLAALERGGRPAPDSNARPNPDDFELGDSDTKYVAAVARWEARQEFQQQDQQRQKAQQTQEQKRAQEDWQNNLDGFLSKGLEDYDDFDEVVTNDDVKFSPAVVALFFESEYGPQIAYDAANDPKVAKEVSAMSPQRQAAWFGRKEAEYSSGSSDADGEDEDDDVPAEPPQTTKAPKPLRKSRGGNSAPEPVTGATTNFAQFEQVTMHKAKGQ